MEQLRVEKKASKTALEKWLHERAAGWKKLRKIALEKWLHERTAG